MIAGISVSSALLVVAIIIIAIVVIVFVAIKWVKPAYRKRKESKKYTIVIYIDLSIDLIN